MIHEPNLWLKDISRAWYLIMSADLDSFFCRECWLLLEDCEEEAPDRVI